MPSDTHGLPDPNYLAPEARAALERKAFEAVANVGFLKWRQEEHAIGEEVTEEDRKAYMQHMQETYWPEFQNLARNAGDAQLYDTLEEYQDLANAMGLLEWRQEQRRKEAPKPEGGRSGLGYPLPEPSASPSRAQEVEGESRWAPSPVDYLSRQQCEDVLGLMEAEGIAMEAEGIAREEERLKREGRSVLGYPLPEPSPPPSPEQRRIRGR